MRAMAGQLRKQARQSGTTVKVAKNRLAKIALEGTDVASIGPLLKGPTLIAYSSDPVGASKVAVDFAKGHELRSFECPVCYTTLRLVVRRGNPGLLKEGVMHV